MHRSFIEQTRRQKFSIPKLYEMIENGRPLKILGWIDAGYQSVGFFKQVPGGDNLFHLISKMGKGVFAQLSTLFFGNKLEKIMSREEPQLSKNEHKAFVERALMERNNDGKAPWHYIIDQKDAISFSAFCDYLMLFDPSSSRQIIASLEFEIISYLTKNPKLLPEDFITNIIRAKGDIFFEEFYATRILPIINPKLFQQISKLFGVSACAKLSDKEAGLIFRASFAYDSKRDGDLIGQKITQQAKKLVESAGLDAVIDASNLHNFVDFDAGLLTRKQKVAIIDLILGEGAAAQILEQVVDIVPKDQSSMDDVKTANQIERKLQEDKNFSQYFDYLVKKIDKNCTETVYKQLGPDASDVHKIILITCRNKEYLDNMLSKASRKNYWPKTNIDDFIDHLISNLEKQDFYQTSMGKIKGNIYTIACAHRDSAIAIKISQQGKEIGLYQDHKEFLDIAFKYRVNDIIFHLIDSNLSSADWYHILSRSIKYANTEILSWYANSDSPKVLDSDYGYICSSDQSIVEGKYTILNRIINSVVQLASAASYVDVNKLQETSQKICKLVDCFDMLCSQDKIYWGHDSTNSCQILRKTFSLLAKLKVCSACWRDIDEAIYCRLDKFHSDLLGSYESILADVPNSLERQCCVFMDAARSGDIDIFSTGTKFSHLSALSDIGADTIDSDNTANSSNMEGIHNNVIGDL